MPDRTPRGGYTRPHAVVAALLASAGGAAVAQSAEPAAVGLASEPSPYYIGASQSLTHDSNVYRVPDGPSDNYSSTSLLGGFSQAISRQRVFGSASVSLNRYQDENRLDNTSYGLVAGVDWATIMKLAGNVTVNLDRRLAAPAASADSPVAKRNLENRKGISALGRWGGESVLTVEARIGYSTLDYSAVEYVASESTHTFGSLGLFYRPGSLLRLGIAFRPDRTHTPRAVQLADGSFESNQIRGRNLDLLADYNNGNSLSSSARLSYTRQTNSSVDNADFSGLTGGLNLSYRATAKISLNLAAARDAGFNSSTGAYTPIVVVPVPVTGTTQPPVTGPANTTAILYENNQVTNSVSLGATYAATAKINVGAGVRYARAKIITSTAVATSGSQAMADVIDKARGATLSASYEYSRRWTFACNLSRELRDVSGAISYSYGDTSAGCSAQLIWR